MKVPRPLHKLWAEMNGYFWHPCPKCGQYFGGHEIPYWLGEIITDENSKVLCPVCAKEINAKRRSL